MKHNHNHNKVEYSIDMTYDIVVESRKFFEKKEWNVRNELLGISIPQWVFRIPVSYAIFPEV